jgi:hypothetical protein
MFQLFDLNNPIKNSIIFFIISISIILYCKPVLLSRNYKNNYNKFYLPIVIIIISVITYYIFSILKLFFT